VTLFFHFGDDLGGLFVRWWSRRTPAPARQAVEAGD